MNLRKAVPALALAALCVVGCHSGSPTSTSSFQVVVQAGLANTALMPTILDAQLVFDGSLVQDLPQSPAASLVTLSASGGVNSGAHTVQFIIANQTTTPNNYTVTTPSIEVLDAAGNFVKTITLPVQSGSLATGQGFTYQFTL
jgi:hypothetical protein